LKASKDPWSENAWHWPAACSQPAAATPSPASRQRRPSQRRLLHIPGFSSFPEDPLVGAYTATARIQAATRPHRRPAAARTRNPRPGCGLAACSPIKSPGGWGRHRGWAGCLEHRETITVDPDGTVTIEARFTTDSEDELYEGDGGWIVVESVEIDDDEQERFHLVADAVFPPEVQLPANYAVPGDADTDLYLQFPTTVTIEDRPDGVYYHFHRRYPGRGWAQIEALRELLVEEKLKKLQDTPLEEYTRQDYVLVLRSYADFEAVKMLTFARAAFLEVTPNAPQDTWLKVHAAIHEFKGELEADRIARLMEIEDEQERDEALDAEGKRWEERNLKRLQDVVREHCGYGGRQMSDFLRHYERNRRFFEITGDLGDDAFEITVVLPGTIVGSNADSTEGNRATWKFSGQRFRDRDLELMATSRLDYE
jgi:hypothetical protein